MSVNQIGPDQFELGQSFPLPVNCFLVRETDGFTLIDTSIWGSAARLIQSAANLGAPIRRIALTHAHADHAGSLDAMARKLPGLEILIGRKEAPLLKGEGQKNLPGSFVHATTFPTRLVDDGDRIGSLRVIFAPGHTPGHVAYFDERSGALFAGDAFTLQGGPSVAGDLRWRFPFPAWATWDARLSLETAKRLAALKPAALCVGHGTFLADPQTALQQAISHLEKKILDKGRLITLKSI